MTRRTTRIHDVAKAAGVSTATVSRAISNPDLLSEATRAAVFDAIRATGYRANRAARNLRTQRAGAVVVLVPNLGNPFFSDILAGISAGMSGSDNSVLIADTADLPPQDSGILGYFLDGRVDGVISLDGGLPAETLARLARSGLSDRIVFACEWPAQDGFPSVRSDNELGARMAIGHLYDLGHRRIAHLTGPADNVLTVARRQAVIEAGMTLDLPAREDWIIRGDFSLNSGRQAGARILAMADRPSAVFCASDEMAFGLISALTAGGVRVPQDMSVVGFDDIGLSDFYIPALTTIRQDRRALGQTAAALMLARLVAQPPEPPPAEVHLVGVALVVRASTAPPPP